MKRDCRARAGLGLLPAILVLAASFAVAQEMTERHIPVGAYPSMESRYLATGTITDVDEDAKLVTLEKDGSERSFRLSGNTRIWLDRSLLGQTTLDGDVSDLVSGLEAEIRTLGPRNPDEAFWVKVQISSQ